MYSQLVMLLDASVETVRERFDRRLEVALDGGRRTFSMRVRFAERVQVRLQPETRYVRVSDNETSKREGHATRLL